MRQLSDQGLRVALREVQPNAVLITGYNHRLYQAVFYQAWKWQIPILFRAETTDHAIQQIKFPHYDTVFSTRRGNIGDSLQAVFPPYDEDLFYAPESLKPLIAIHYNIVPDYRYIVLD
ncbi:hypothetical protein [Umezakia ovalisporum]|uniref:hypothetical protein n=1 Tax=Umezakia ovalisporum TaxID=75695 RepID=UPI0026B0F968